MQIPSLYVCIYAYRSKSTHPLLYTIANLLNYGQVASYHSKYHLKYLDDEYHVSLKMSFIIPQISGRWKFISI
jgi:hypothetical protein